MGLDLAGSLPYTEHPFTSWSSSKKTRQTQVGVAVVRLMREHGKRAPFCTAEVGEGSPVRMPESAKGGKLK